MKSVGSNEILKIQWDPGDPMRTRKFGLPPRPWDGSKNDAAKAGYSSQPSVKRRVTAMLRTTSPS